MSRNVNCSYLSTIFTMHRLFITAIFLTIDNMWCIWLHVGQLHSFWKERTLVKKETLRIYKKAISPWSDTKTAKGTHEPQQESTCKRVQWWAAPVSIVKCLWNLCGLVTTGIWTVWDCALERIGKTHLQPVALLLKAHILWHYTEQECLYCQLKKGMRRDFKHCALATHT